MDHCFLLGPHFDADALPALKTLELGNWNGNLQTALQGEEADANFPWAQLQYISLDCFVGDYPSVLRLLKACPNLTRFSVEARYRLFDASGDESRESVSLENLEELHFTLEIPTHETRPSHLLELFPLIVAPKLQRLGIRHCRGMRDPDVDAAIRLLIDGSKCGIRTLEVSKSWDNEDPEDGHLTPIPYFITTIAPHLEHLTICSDYPSGFDSDSSSILERMVVVDEHGEYLLPRLKSLRIVGLTLDPVLLGQIIQTRQEQACQGIQKVNALQRIEVEYDVNRPSFNQSPASEHYKATLDTILADSNVPISCQLEFDPRNFAPRFAFEEEEFMAH